MNIDDLVAEAGAMARTAFHLSTVPSNSGVVGYWGGESADYPNDLGSDVSYYSGRRHIFSLSEKVLAQTGVERGPMSLFEWEESEEGDLTYRVEADDRVPFAEIEFSGEPLYAKAVLSLPPFVALCLYGGPQIEAWLRGLGLARHEYWKVDGDLPRLYEAYWEERSPLLASADVIAGGWHILWPAEDYYIPQEVQLAALSLRDAEPWFEIWYSPRSQGFRARERNT